MDLITRVLGTAGKASLLASVLFAFFLIIEEPQIGTMILLILLVFIAVNFFVSLFMIATTILPFYLLQKDKDHKEAFNGFFPLYAIVFFLLLTVIIIKLRPETIVVYFTIAIFITAMQSWVWFFKNTNNKS